MAQRICLLLLVFVPFWSAAQSDCFAVTGDCSQAVPQEFQYTYSVECGDTIALFPTAERCNAWSIPPSTNYYFGSGADSTTAYVIIEECTTDSLIVEGVTLTANGSDTSACRTTIWYNLVQSRDTILQELSCEEFFALDALRETVTNSCGCDSLLIEYYASDFSGCIDCGLQCIYITGSTSISGGETEGAEVVVTYVLNGDTLTAGRADWTGEVDLLDCFDAEDELMILEAQAFVPSGGSGSASADAWLVSNPGISDTTRILNRSCEAGEVGVVIDTLQAVSGCDSLVITTTELYPQPEVFTWDQIECLGETITLVAIGESDYDYEWNTGAQTAQLTVNEPGLYTVTVTDLNGCTATAAAQASFNDIEVVLNASVFGPLLISTSPLEVWQGAAVQLDAQVFGTPFSYEIIWNGGAEVGDSTYNYVPSESGEFKVAVIDSIGCIDISVQDVLVRQPKVFIPNAFSPNGDGINDELEVFTSPNVEEMRLQIFSRNGAMVYDEVLREPEILAGGLKWLAWNGEFNGASLTPQILAYQLQYRAIRGEWQILAGDVLLTR